MDHKRTCGQIQKDVNNNSYEIIELNESEPIVFKQTTNKQQEIGNTLNSQKRITLVIPKTTIANSHKYSDGRLN